MSFQDGFLSEIVGRKAVVGSGPERKAVGKVVDFLVAKPEATFPLIDGLIIQTPSGPRYAPIAEVVDVNDAGVVRLKTVPLETPVPEDRALYLIKDLFDKQIVDVDGRKVVRINDLEVANTGGALRVVAADIGASGLLRRLIGSQPFARGMIRRVPTSVIAWDNVAPIHDVNPVNVRLSVSESRLARLHPSELADIITDLSTKDAARIFESLDDEAAADALEHLDAETQRSLIEGIGTQRAADIIEEMDSDDAADLLGKLDEARQAELLAEMEPEYAGELRDLVKYDAHSAGGLMTTDYVWIYPHRTVAATIAKIREIGPESEFIYYLYVTDQHRTLLGVVSLRTLLLALPTGFIHRLMESDVVTVAPDTSAQDVASTIARFDLLAVPVIDPAGRMLGIVTVDDAIDAIMPEKVANSLPRFTRHRSRRSDVAGT